MGKKIDLTGKRFGRLVVLKEAGRNKSNNIKWVCKCDCGSTVTIQGGHLVSGHTKSCGCLRIEDARKRHTIHGKHETTEYVIWQGMKQRCIDTNQASYKHYGGRGIQVCDRWVHSFENFLLDIGKRPSKNYSLDRIDNNGNYTPKNCRWATIKIQSRNKRTNCILVYNNVAKTVVDWAQDLNMKANTLYKRLYAGWSVSRALSTPVYYKYSAKEK